MEKCLKCEELRAERNAAIKKNAPMFASAEAYFEVNAVEAERDNLKEELAAIKAENVAQVKITDRLIAANLKHVAENEKLKEELDSKTSHAAGLQYSFDAYKKRNDQLLADLKEAVEALRWADENLCPHTDAYKELEKYPKMQRAFCDCRSWVYRLDTNMVKHVLSTLTAKYDLGDWV